VKRLELMRDLSGSRAAIAILVNPASQQTDAQVKEVETGCTIPLPAEI